MGVVAPPTSQTTDLEIFTKPDGRRGACAVSKTELTLTDTRTLTGRRGTQLVDSLVVHVSSKGVRRRPRGSRREDRGQGRPMCLVLHAASDTWRREATQRQARTTHTDSTEGMGSNGKNTREGQEATRVRHPRGARNSPGKQKQTRPTRPGRVKR